MDTAEEFGQALDQMDNCRIEIEPRKKLSRPSVYSMTWTNGGRRRRRHPKLCHMPRPAPPVVPAMQGADGTSRVRTVPTSPSAIPTLEALPPDRDNPMLIPAIDPRSIDELSATTHIAHGRVDRPLGVCAVEQWRGFEVDHGPYNG